SHDRPTDPGIPGDRLSRGRSGRDRAGGSGDYGPMKLPKATGPFPAGTVATTVFVAVAITDIVLALVFATYTLFPSGVTARPSGLSPAVRMWVTTVFVAVSITPTVPTE